ncbi:hypothetical protein TruAng_007485 [Truncatella angustata]|nr:hypothetical protein TruAng_007485 [Truncatella angustata]
MTSSELHQTLNVLDYIPPCNYVRLLFPLPLRSGVENELVFDELHLALQKTFIQEPWASGKVFRQSSDAPDWRPGQLEIRYRTCSLDDPRPHQLQYRQLDTDWTYDELRDCGFPSDIFPEELLLEAPAALGDVAVAGADVFLAQANFLPGGLLLAFTTSHASTDATGMLSLFKLWANNFSELHGRDEGCLVAPSRFTSEDRDRRLLDRIWANDLEGPTPSNNSDDPWLRTLVSLDANYPGESVADSTQQEIAGGADPPGHPLVMLNRVMFLSGQDLTTLKNECLAEPSPQGSSPISSSDAINALVWRGVLRARSAAAAARSRPLEDAVSVFESPVDVRARIGSGFPQDYLGNCFLLNNARIPVAELIAPSTPLGRIAQAIREGATRLDTQKVREAYTFLRATPDLSRVQGRFVERHESADLLISNLVHFPLNEISFGDRYFGNGGIPQSFRVLHARYAPYVRLGHILPRNQTHGGVEISLNLFDDEMVYWENDEEINRYLVAIEA